MSKKFIAVAILGVFLFSGVAGAQTNDLPDPGTLPGSPLYFVKSFFEGVGTFFTFGDSAKAERYLTLAEKRLAEAQALAEQGDERAQATVARYEEQYAEAKDRAGRTGEIDLEVKVTDATTRHLSVLDQVLERVSEQAREHVREAKERTMTGQIEALRGIAQRDPESAAGIFATAAEGRLQAAQAKAEQGGDDEEEAEEVEKALNEYEKYAQFGEEISQIAQGLRTGETEVRTLIERATEQHLQVLEDVKEEVPPQAQEGISRAMQNAERVKQFLPSDIPGRVGPGGQGEGVQEGIPQELESEEQDETNGGAPTETPGAGSMPEGVGGDDEDEEAEQEQQQGGPPENIPGARP